MSAKRLVFFLAPPFLAEEDIRLQYNNQDNLLLPQEDVLEPAGSHDPVPSAVYTEPQLRQQVLEVWKIWRIVLKVVFVEK